MRIRSRPALILLALAVLPAAGVGAAPATVPATGHAAVVRVAAIGGINDLDFWAELTARFSKATGIRVETVATGNKDGAAALFRQGGVDLITMQSGDAIMDLVAGGYAMDPQPWVQADLAIVGPVDDPAGIKGMTDAAAALKKIVRSGSALVVHANSGADQVVRGIMQGNRAELDSAHTTVLFDDHQRRVLQAAAGRKAYTLIARVPFASGKIKGDGLALMVAGDPVLRRPYVVAVADPAKVAGAHVAEARRLAGFLRGADAQRWIGEFGRGKFGDGPVYFPVRVVGASEAGGVLVVGGEVKTPVTLDEQAFGRLPQHQARVKGHDGKEAVYEGVLVGDVLKRAGVPLGTHQMRGSNLAMYVVVEAADGYRAVFALPELDDQFGERSVLLASRRDGRPLDEEEGPLRLIAPQEGLQSRWVRRVTRLTVLHVE